MTNNENYYMKNIKENINEFADELISFKFFQNGKTTKDLNLNLDSISALESFLKSAKKEFKVKRYNEILKYVKNQVENISPIGIEMVQDLVKNKLDESDTDFQKICKKVYNNIK